MASQVDPGRAAEIRTALEAFIDAHNTRDWDRVRAALAEHFRFADHRPTGFGIGEGVDAYMRILQVAVELVPDRKVTLMEVVAGAPAEVLHFVATGTDEFGSKVDWDFFGVWDVRDGLLTGLDVFATDDYEGAVTCADSLPGR